MSNEEPSGFNTRLWRRFVQIARPYWQSEERWRSRGLLALLVLLLLGQTAFNVWFNHETGEFTSALAAGDADSFWASIPRYTLILVPAVPKSYARLLDGKRAKARLRKDPFELDQTDDE